MGVIYNDSDPTVIERRSWEQPNYNPHDPKNAYPKMLYRAVKRPDGKPSTGESMDHLFGGHPGAAEAFSKGCQRVVKSTREHEMARDEGWRDNHKEAMAYLEGLEKAVSDAAAYRHAEDAKMGERARAEAEAADASTSQHVAEVPEAPRQKRKYTRKAEKPSLISG